MAQLTPPSEQAIPEAKSRLDKLLDAAEMEMLCSLPAPCFTIFLPRYRPAAQSAPETVPLKHLLRIAEESPEVHKLGETAAALLEPLREIAKSAALGSGGEARALFSAPGFAAAYRSDAELQEKLALGRHPYIRPLLAQAFAPREVFALALGRKRLRLFRFAADANEERPLPPGVPASVAEAEAFDQPDHDLQNRSASGTSTGTRFAVTFGTLSDRESAPEYLHDYFTSVDRELYVAVKNAPVFLLGVSEDLAAFRKVSRHLNLLATESEGSVDGRGAAEIGPLTRAAALASYQARGEAVLREFREMPDRTRTLSGTSRVLAAAESGRVHQLLLPEEGDIPAHQDSSHQNLLASEDLLNATAVETLRRRGQVFALPTALLGAEPLAILRY
jgi:Bacterial archaeo-eukaryotic release factor family 3